jgi:tetratricopeptide (TPR) repeat protein
MNAPSHLGRYEIRGELGRGAMGVVYAGFDPAIERTVAIKVLQLDKLADAISAEMRTRFRREAQAAGRLSHPHIVAVYEYNDGDVAAGGSSGFPYIVMERVDGRTLKAMFDEQIHFKLADTVRLMGQLLAALQHAHERGVVHRDIKPSNLMVLKTDAVPSIKVTDFGIARLDSSDLTLTGTTLGTATHMSPEQFLGQPVDRRTDLYASGVILYQFLTGELPFNGSPSTIMQKVLNQEALAPSLLNPTVPSTWDAVLRRAMAKKPADRFASAADFDAAIRTASLGVDPDATVVRPVQTQTPRTRSSTAVVGGFTAVGAAVIALGIYVAGWRTTPVAAVGDAASAPVTASSGVAGPAIGDPRPAPPIPVPEHVATLSAEEIEELAWADAAAANTVAAYRAFLHGYPKGRFAGRAQVRIAALEPRPSTPKPAPAPAPAPSPLPVPVPAPPSPAPVLVPPAAPAASVQPLRGSAPVTSLQAACRENPDSNPACPLQLGILYFNLKDFSQALKWFRVSADKGVPNAQNFLGMMYLRGQGVTRDSNTGFAWLKKAADQGFPQSESTVGVCFEQGDGAPKSLPNAVEWYRKSAEHGNSFGQNNLARMLLLGRGVAKDPKQALDLFRRSADQRNPYGANSLGRIYERGEFVTADKQQAAQWFRLALQYDLAGAVARDPWGDMKAIEHAQAFIAANP